MNGLKKVNFQVAVCSLPHYDITHSSEKEGENMSGKISRKMKQTQDTQTADATGDI